MGVGDGGLVPSRPLEKITLEHVRKAVEGAFTSAAAGSSLVARAVAGVEEEGLRRLAEVTYRELCDSERPLEKAVPREPAAAEQATSRRAPTA